MSVERLDILDQPTWFDQPGELIVDKLADAIKAERVFKLIFDDRIEPYMRMDFGVRELPAIRMFNSAGRKESETGYFTGEIKMDVIFPPAVRREELQRYPSRVVSALLAQFRRQKFFAALCEEIPGLNEMGKVFNYDNTLAFVAKDTEELCPMVQLVVGWRILLADWDLFLESDERTTDDPFERTLGDLERLTVEVQAVLDSGTKAPIAPDRFNVKT